MTVQTCLHDRSAGGCDGRWPGPDDPRDRYSLWAHVDRVGDGAVASGDLITTVNVPVTADDIAAGRSYDVPVTRI